MYPPPTPTGTAQQNGSCTSATEPLRPLPCYCDLIHATIMWLWTSSTAIPFVQCASFAPNRV
ncbi:hypothetical protein PAXRUDRAFT_835842 [Paxillus rubicundulus Ve08.2h10]|uniref:Uncharacterized protein n=1 Tax=Paxillus rubicundulus Ve08.2h10 TaxID=930991 RepID=A0A0D0D4R8_9AGAM|nr:hypothetical protein PAXRUDRAFT_835842 [Paxillus rubicundulus Ve08.2h10]